MLGLTYQARRRRKDEMRRTSQPAVHVRHGMMQDIVCQVKAAGDIRTGAMQNQPTT
jgi:hypothetical protein